MIWSLLWEQSHAMTLKHNSSTVFCTNLVIFLTEQWGLVFVKQTKISLMEEAGRWAGTDVLGPPCTWPHLQWQKQMLDYCSGVPVKTSHDPVLATACWALQANTAHFNLEILTVSTVLLHAFILKFIWSRLYSTYVAFNLISLALIDSDLLPCFYGF